MKQIKEIFDKYEAILTNDILSDEENEKITRQIVMDIIESIFETKGQSSMAKEKTSKYKGVSFDKSKGKWISNYKGKCIGRFDNELAAAIHYDMSVIKDRDNKPTNIVHNPYYITFGSKKPRNTLIDLTSQIFGNLFVVARANNNTYGQARWVCKCICSEDFSYRIVTTGSLNDGSTTTCKNCKKNNYNIDAIIQNEEEFTPLHLTDKEVQTNVITTVSSEFELNGIKVQVNTQIVVDKRFVKKSDVYTILDAFKQLFHQNERELHIQ